MVTEVILSSGLYSGFGWSTLSRISGLGARFGLYELLTGFYKGILMFGLHFFCFFGLGGCGGVCLALQASCR